MGKQTDEHRRWREANPTYYRDYFRKRRQKENEQKRAVAEQAEHEKNDIQQDVNVREKGDL